jgi:hypothetical protein
MMIEKRRVGRPTKEPERRLSVTVQISVTVDEADALYANARRMRCSVAEIVRSACRRSGVMCIEDVSATRSA